MFSVGASEIFLILIIAIIFLKPSDIPKYARLLGRWYKKLKDVYAEIEKTKSKVFSEIDNNIKESVVNENTNSENSKENVIKSNSENIEVNMEINSKEESHLFYTTDFFPHNMKTLIIGSFPIPLYTNESLYYTLDEESRLNAWYYSSKKNEFWKIMADIFKIKDKESFIKNKEEKINLFEENLIGITDIALVCERKDSESSDRHVCAPLAKSLVQNQTRMSMILPSDDKNLIIKKYNTKLIDTIKNYNNLKNIIFTSKFSEDNFYKMLKNENFDYKIKNIKTPKIKTLDDTILSSLKIKKIIIEDNQANKKQEIMTVAISLKRSSVKGVSLYTTKKTLFNYFLLK